MSAEDKIKPFVMDATQHPPEVPLVSGIPIPFSFVRTALQESVENAYQTWYPGWRKDAIVKANRYFDGIAKTTGIVIVEERRMEEDYKYRCAEYAFGTRKGHGWFSDEHTVRDFWMKTHDFLLAHGYDAVDKPQAEDVIGYGFPREKNGLFLRHFGIYEGEGKVTSKFDMGHVFSHPWTLVPLQYGTHIQFFRKQEPER